MKKLIVSAAIAALFSVSVSVSAGPFKPDPVTGPVAGDSDASQATIRWAATIPVVVPGNFVTFTGAHGSPKILDGVLVIDPDGGFTSKAVALELHYFDDETQTVEGNVIVGEEAVSGVTASSITYSVDNVTFTSEMGVELDGVAADIMQGNQVVVPNEDLEMNDTDGWKTSWSIRNAMTSFMPTVVSGDKITATTVVYANVNFAAK
jgi:hypothetical protein